MVLQKPRAGVNPGFDAAIRYPLIESVLNRRSRRFALGSEVPGGHFRYRSRQAPVPLSELEEAFLVEAATGASGLILGDLPFRDERSRHVGGNTLVSYQGRTWPSPCSSHGTRLFYWNDEGTYMIRPENAPATRVQQFTPERLEDQTLTALRATRVQLFEGRVEHPRSYPAMLPLNIWSSNLPGSTMFLPVTDVTEEYINLLFLMCGWPDGGIYLIDDQNGNRPAGTGRWAKEGLLNKMFAVPLSSFATDVSALESGFIIQNLLLAEQAAGLGGWVHAHPSAPILLGGTPLSRGLGFRFVATRSAAGKPASVPVGIDGLMEAYCPPYFRTMADAVDALVEKKFGEQGLYAAGSELPYAQKNEFLNAVPRYTDKLIQCVKDVCAYVYDTYGRFPSHVDPITTEGAWVQAHHLDLEFYDQFYGPGSYTETQARHMELWHAGEEA